MISQNKPTKYNFQGYSLLILFKTDYTLEITATDQFTLETFQNKSVQFNKMQKDAIIAALQRKSEQHLKCNIKRLKQNNNCLQLQFLAKFQFIPPFQQSTILYKIVKAQKQVKIPTLDRKEYMKFKSQLQQIQNMIPVQKVPIKTIDLPNTQLRSDTKQRQQFFVVIIGSNIALFIIFLFFISFSNYFVLVLLLNAGFYFYQRNYSYKLASIQIKRGIYSVQLYGVYNSLSYNSIGCTLKFNLVGNHKNFTSSVKCYNMYSYGYPINFSMILNVKKDGQWNLSVKKDTVFEYGQITNGLIVIQPTTYLVSEE